MNGDATGLGESQILTVRGELDLATADSLYLRAQAAISRRARLLLLDLSGVSFCDACGLSALVRIANDADKAECRYGIIAPQPNVARILRITGLDHRLHIITAIDDELGLSAHETIAAGDAETGPALLQPAETLQAASAAFVRPDG